MAGQAGYGTKLQQGDGASPTEGFTTIANVTSLSGPSSSGDVLDVSDMDSPAAFREKVMGMLDAGEVTFSCNFRPAEGTQLALRTALAAREAVNFRIVDPTNTKRFVFSAVVSAVGNAFPFDDKLTLDATLSITGQPVYEDVA